MNAGQIWWGQIGNSLRFLSSVTNHLRDCHSAVLQVPQTVPWRQEFYDAIDMRRTSFSGDRRLMRLSWDESTEPGEFVLVELCSSRVRADYWPGQSYAEYLGSKEDIVLNEYYGWITGIHSKSGLAKWAEFVSQYESIAKKMDQAAVFLLEYDGVTVDVAGVEKIVYSMENYDCRVFCLETAAALANSDSRSYQAELALSIGRGEPELCAALLEKGRDLLEKPVETAQSVLQERSSSQGLRFAEMAEMEIESAVWKAAVVLLFPILEQYRSDFIATHETELARHLPISNSNGDRITDPHDLEIGSIQYIVSNAKAGFSSSDVEMVKLCRKARNLLAHNRIVPYQDIISISRLARESKTKGGVSL